MQRLTEAEGDTIAQELDYFWSIAPDALYNVCAEPGEPGISQLSESWQRIAQLLRDDSAVMPYHLVWLADIIRALGHPQTQIPLTP